MIVPESKTLIKKKKKERKKNENKEKFYQYINFTECKTSYLREICKNIFAFML